MEEQKIKNNEESKIKFEIHLVIVLIYAHYVNSTTDDIRYHNMKFLRVPRSLVCSINRENVSTDHVGVGVQKLMLIFGERVVRYLRIWETRESREEKYLRVISAQFLVSIADVKTSFYFFVQSPTIYEKKNIGINVRSNWKIEIFRVKKKLFKWIFQIFLRQTGKSYQHQFDSFDMNLFD